MGDIRITSLHRYPELAAFDSAEAARDALQECKNRIWHTPSTWLVLVVYGCAVSVAVYFGLGYARRWVEIPPGVFGGVAGGITGGSSFAAVNWLFRRRCRQLLRDRLASMGVPLCRMCGYDLRAQSEPRCPECFTPFDPAQHA